MAGKPQIVILISGRGSNMRAIIEACRRGDIEAEVALVISNNPDAAGLEFAESCDILTRVLSHKNYESREAFDTDLAALITPFHPDVICLAGFMRILSASFVKQFSGKMLNIHPSLLPKYKGLHTHRRALEAGDTEAGCSVHIVTPALDDGPVLMQRRVPILPEDSEGSLAARVLAVEHECYVAAVKAFLKMR